MAGDKTNEIVEFLKVQQVLDMQLTLADLAKNLGSEPMRYTFAMDKYVYKTANIGDPGKISIQGVDGKIHRTQDTVLNMNIKLADLIKQAKDNKLDDIAGYVYTEDKFTFVVASEVGNNIGK
jgi:hypothetical protein